MSAFLLNGLRCFGLVAGLVPALGWAQAHAAHTHGQARLDIAQEGRALVLNLTLPLDTAVGFERAPRTAAERQRAEQALTRLRLREGGFQPDVAAMCQAREPQLTAGPLAAPVSAQQAHDDHADIEVRYHFDCAQPERLQTLTTDVFNAWARLQGVEVQVVTPRGQWRQSLRRPERSIRLTR
jgi:Protein of unknown function (DUF2796)